MVIKKKKIESVTSFIQTVTKLAKVTEIQSDMAQRINQVLVDSESIKRDTAYELFYIRKKDGSRFFTPKQLKSLKNAAELGEYLDHSSSENLINLEECRDKIVNIAAKNTLKTLIGKINRFFHESQKNRKMELVRNLYSCIMALMLASHRENRFTRLPLKSCYDYYKDFQSYLYVLLQSKEYQKYIVYPPSDLNGLAHAMLDLIHSICKNVILHSGNYQEIIPFFHEYIEKKENESIKREITSVDIIHEYENMKKKLKPFSYKPLKLILKSIEEGDANYFAPLKQGNLPLQLYSIYYQDKKCINLHLPGPIHQDYIDNAFVDEIFLGYLKSLQKDQSLNKHLFINLQDRTDWRESSRSRTIENLNKASVNKRCLNVITFPMDTDFYHQHSPYSENHNYQIFFEHFKNHLSDLSSGFYFSDEIKEKIFPKFCNDLGRDLHQIFFADKTELNIEERKNYIDIFYFFLILKIIEITQSEIINFSCKDGIDLGGSLNLIFFTMMKYVNNLSFNKNDLDFIFYLLFGSPLVLRERIMFKERAERYFSLLKKLENLKKIHEETSFAMIISEIFSNLYQSKLLQGQVVPAHLF